MEEINEMIPVVEEYIFRRKGIKVTINVNQFNVHDMFALGSRVGQLNSAFLIAREWLNNNPN